MSENRTMAKTFDIMRGLGNHFAPYVWYTSTYQVVVVFDINDIVQVNIESGCVFRQRIFDSRDECREFFHSICPNLPPTVKFRFQNNELILYSTYDADNLDIENVLSFIKVTNEV